MHFSVIKHGMTSSSFPAAEQENKAKLSSFVQFEKETSSVLTVSEHSHI